LSKKIQETVNVLVKATFENNPKKGFNVSKNAIAKFCFIKDLFLKDAE
jgi:hypothetical protein